MLKKLLVFRGVPFPIIAWPQVSVSLNSQPVDYILQRGRDLSPPKACFIWGAQLFDWLSKYYEYTVAKQNYEYTVAKQNVGGAEWVELFITLTKGMGEPTYGL